MYSIFSPVLLSYISPILPTGIFIFLGQSSKRHKGLSIQQQQKLEKNLVIFPSYDVNFIFFFKSDLSFNFGLYRALNYYKVAPNHNISAATSSGYQKKSRKLVSFFEVMHHQQFVIKTKAWGMCKKGIQITEAVHLEIDPREIPCLCYRLQLSQLSFTRS